MEALSSGSVSFAAQQLEYDASSVLHPGHIGHSCRFRYYSRESVAPDRR